MVVPAESSPGNLATGKTQSILWPFRDFDEWGRSFVGGADEGSHPTLLAWS